MKSGRELVFCRIDTASSIHWSAASAPPPLDPRNPSAPRLLASAVSTARKRSPARPRRSLRSGSLAASASQPRPEGMGANGLDETAHLSWFSLGAPYEWSGAVALPPAPPLLPEHPALSMMSEMLQMLALVTSVTAAAMCRRSPDSFCVSEASCVPSSSRPSVPPALSPCSPPSPGTRAWSGSSDWRRSAGV